MRRSALCGIFMHDLTGLPGKANGGGTVATKAVPRHARLTIHLKGGRQWTLSLDKETVDALLPWIDWLNTHKPADVKVAHRVPASQRREAAGADCPCQGPLFRSLARPRLNGSVLVRGAMSEHGVYFVMQDRATKAGLRARAYPHMFRNTLQSWLEKKGVPVEKIRMLTGHLTDEMVEKYGPDGDKHAMSGEDWRALANGKDDERDDESPVSESLPSVV